VPDPDLERQKKLFVYDASEYYDAEDPFEWTEIEPGHFALVNKKIMKAA
jgi:hypothetical protein